MADNKNYDARIQAVCLVLLTLVTVAVTLHLVKSVIVPFVLAVFLTMIMIPVVEFLIRKLRVRRSIALFLTLVLGFMLIGGLGVIVVNSVTQFQKNAAEYEVQVTKLIDKFEQVIPMDAIMKMIPGDESSDPSVPGENVEELPEVTSTEEVATESSFDLSALLPKGAIQSTIIGLTGGILAIASMIFLVMLFTAFLLTGSTTHSKKRDGLLGEIENRVQKYIGIKIVLSLFTGGFVFVILKFFGIDFALAFGVFAFILNFIPNVGSLIATALPLCMLSLTPNMTWGLFGLIFLLLISVQIIIGNAIEPKLMGDTLGLHPIVILMALVFWGILWGLPGMLLAAPMTSITKIVFERIEVTKPIAALLGGRIEVINEMTEEKSTP